MVVYLDGLLKYILNTKYKWIRPLSRPLCVSLENALDLDFSVLREGR